MINVKATINDVSIKPVDAYYEFKLTFASPGEANIRTVDLEDSDLDLENVSRKNNITTGLLHIYFEDDIVSMASVKKLLRDTVVLDDNHVELSNVYYGFTIFFEKIDNTNNYELDNLYREIVSLDKLFKVNHQDDILPLMTEVSGNSYKVGKSAKGYNLQYNVYIKTDANTNHPLPDSDIFQEARSKFLSIIDDASTKQESKRTVKDDTKQRSYYKPVVDVSFNITDQAQATIDKYKFNKFRDPLYTKAKEFQKSLKTIYNKLNVNKFRPDAPVARDESGEQLASNFTTFIDMLRDYFENQAEIAAQLGYHNASPEDKAKTDRFFSNIDDPISNVNKTDLTDYDLKRDYESSYHKKVKDQLSKHLGVDTAEGLKDALPNIIDRISGTDNPDSLRAMMNDIIQYFSGNLWESISNMHKIEEAYAATYRKIYFDSVDEKDRPKNFPKPSAIINNLWQQWANLPKSSEDKSEEDMWGEVAYNNLGKYVLTILRQQLSNAAGVSDATLQKIADAVTTNKPQIFWDFYNEFRQQFTDILGEVSPEVIEDVSPEQKEQEHPMLQEKNQDKFLSKLTQFNFSLKDIIPSELLNYTSFSLTDPNDKLRLNNLVRNTKVQLTQAKEALEDRDPILENKLFDLQEQHKSILAALTQSKGTSNLSKQVELENAESLLKERIFKAKQEREGNKVKYQTILNYGFPFIDKVTEYLKENNADNYFEKKDK